MRWDLSDYLIIGGLVWVAPSGVLRRFSDLQQVWTLAESVFTIYCESAYLLCGFDTQFNII